MRSIEQIIHDNGGDNTPALDTHNLTGRAVPEGVEPSWAPYSSAEEYMDAYDSEFGYIDGSYEAWLGGLDCE